MLKVLAVRVPPAVKAKFKAKCKKEGRAMERVIAELLTSYTKRVKQ